ncbi:Asp23/Gls24 family envelope stress response protein [Deinococcus sp. YIM 134068]|uniref:Asp23/Gls24 family envelope stress response protein n=1 Tax=Deinococcus lichenicola TaxID=3118910 RepID=UPI002F92A870
MEVEISRSVLTDIAQTTLDGIEGIEVASASLKVGEVLRQQGGGPRRPRALRVTRDGQNVTVDVGLNVEYGRNLVGVAGQAQRAVSENVELMTGLKVKAVNVTVLGVTLPKGNA